MKLNVTKVLAQKAVRDAQVKPLPKILISGRQRPPESILAPVDPELASTNPLRPETIVDEKAGILKDLWDEMGQIKRDRGKLSSRTAYLVAELEEKIRKENPTLWKFFINGELSEPELADHYAKIQGFTDRAMILYDKIQFVEQHGKLPQVQPAIKEQDIPPDAKILQYEIRRLDDLIYKTQKKIDTGRPKKSERIADWKMKVALAEARRDDLKHKLKRVQYESRAERPGA